MLHDLQGGNNYFGEYHFALHHAGLDTSPGSDPHSWHAHCQNLETLSNILPLEKARKIPIGQGSDSRSSGPGWHRCDPGLSDSRFVENALLMTNIIQAKVNCFSENYILHLVSSIHYIPASIMVCALVLAILTRKIRHENFKTGSVTVLV